MGQVINIQKHSNNGAIAAIAMHNLRHYEPSNADYTKTADNVFYHGSQDIDVLSKVKSLLEGIKYRKDANKVVNLVFSASQSEMAKMDVNKWAIELTDFCKQKFGEQNILYSVLHNDETTKHLHLSFVPLIEGKLRSNLWFDGPAKLAKFRNEIYQINKKYKIKKDTPKQKSKSEKIQDFYSMLNDDNLSNKLEEELKSISKLSNFTLNREKQVEKVAPTILRLAKYLKSLTYKYKNQLKEVNKLNNENKELKYKNSKLKELNPLLDLDYSQIKKLLEFADDLRERKIQKEINENKIQSTSPGYSIPPSVPKGKH